MLAARESFASDDALDASAFSGYCRSFGVNVLATCFHRQSFGGIAAWWIWIHIHNYLPYHLLI